MKCLIRSEFHHVADCVQFICPRCGSDNEIDEQDQWADELECYSCASSWKVRNEYVSEKKGTGILWKQNELRYLINHYPDHRSRDIAEHLSRSVTSVYQIAQRFNLTKSENFCATIWKPSDRKIIGSEKNQFKPGHRPHNKGQKFDAGGRSHQTRYTAGMLPHNTKSDGAITIRRHKKTGVDYKWIRLQLNKWQQLHKYTWEQVHGKVPSGHLVVFRDGNTMNCALENLECITRRENMRRNTIHRYPEDLQQQIKLLNTLERAIQNKTDNAK